MRKFFTDIICAVLLTLLVVCGCAVLSAVLSVAAGLVLLACAPVLMPIVFGWSWWWCVLYLCMTFGIYLLVREHPAVGDDEIDG